MKEGGVSGLQDLGSRRRSNVNKMLEKRKRAIGAAPDLTSEDWRKGKSGLRKEDKEAQIAGINTWQAMNEADDTEAAADEGYKRDFLAWLMGKGKEEDHRRTPWYRDDWMLRHLDDVRNWVETFVDVIYETELAMIKLALNGPTNLQEAEIYYKYLVNLDWMRRDDKFFFVDMVGLINGGSLGGGLTEDELNILNLSTHLRHGPYKGEADRALWHVQGASQEDVFAVSSQTRESAQRLVENKRETLIEKIDAIHRNALEPMQPSGDRDIPDGVLTLNYQTEQHLTPDQLEEAEKRQQLLQQPGGVVAVEAGSELQNAAMLDPVQDFLMSDEALDRIDPSFWEGVGVVGAVFGLSRNDKRAQMNEFLAKAREISAKTDIELGQLLQVSRMESGGFTGPLKSSFRDFMRYRGKDFDKRLAALVPALRYSDEEDAEDAAQAIEELGHTMDTLERVAPTASLVQWLQKPGRVRNFLRSVLPENEFLHVDHDTVKDYAELLKVSHPELVGMYLTAGLIYAFKNQSNLAVGEADKAFDAQMGAVARGEVVNPYLSMAVNDPKRYETMKSLNRVKSSLKKLQPLWRHQFESMDARVFAHIQIGKIWSELVTNSYKAQDLDIIRDTIGIDLREVRNHSDYLRVQAMMGKFMGDDPATRSMIEQFDAFQDRMWAQSVARAAPSLLFLDNMPNEYYSLDFTVRGEDYHWNDIDDAIMSWSSNQDLRMRNWQRALYWHALETTTGWQWAQNMGGVQMFHTAWQALSTVWGASKWALRMVGGAVYIGGRMVVDLFKGKASGKHTLALAYYALAAGSIILGGTPVGPQLARWMELINSAYLAFNAYTFLSGAKDAFGQGRYASGAADVAVGSVLSGYAFPSVPRGTKPEDIAQMAAIQRTNAFTSTVLGVGSDWLSMLAGNRSATTATGAVAEMAGNAVRNVWVNAPRTGVATAASTLGKAWEQLSDGVISGASGVTGIDFKDWAERWLGYVEGSKVEEAHAEYMDLFNQNMTKFVDDVMPLIKNETGIENEAVIRDIAVSATRPGVTAMMVTNNIQDAFTIKYADSPDTAVKPYVEALNAGADELANALTAGQNSTVIANITQGFVTRFEQIAEQQLSNFKKPAIENPLLKDAAANGLPNDAHPITKEWLAAYNTPVATGLESDPDWLGHTTKYSTADVVAVYDKLVQGKETYYGNRARSLLLQKAREDPNLRVQMQEILTAKAESAYASIKPLIQQEARKLASEQIKQQTLQGFTTKAVLEAVASYPDGPEKDLIKDILDDFYAAARIKVQKVVEEATEGDETDVKERLDAFGRKQTKETPTAGFGQFAFAAGAQAVAFDLVSGKGSLAHDLWSRGATHRQFEEYKKDWQAKDKALFDSDFQDTRRREMAWKDDSFNRANASVVQAMMEMSQNPNTQQRAAVMAKLFGMNKDYKFLRTNLIARMGFTGFSGIHAFMGRGKRTIKQPWKKNKPARTLEEPKKSKKSKKSGMPKALGLQKNPSTKGLRKRLKRASWNARHQGDMRAKSTANAMKRALKWGIVKPGDWAFNKIVQWAADSLGEDLQTHEQLLERASARDLLEAVQGALQALPRTHEELYALARPREADALGRPAPVVQPEAPGREEGAPPPPSARNHDELYALALDAQARGYLEQVRAVQ